MACVRIRRENWGFFAGRLDYEGQGYGIGFHWHWQPADDAYPGYFRRSVMVKFYKPVQHIRWQWPVRVSGG